MVSLQRLIVFVLAFTFYQLETVTMFPYPFTSLVAPINKHIDAAKPLYSVQMMAQNSDTDNYLLRNLLIDIDAPLTWHQCILKDTIVQGFFCPYPDTLCNYPLLCNDDPCRQLQITDSYHNPSCPSINNVDRPRDVASCTCPVNVLDPVTGSCGVAFANYDHFTMHTSKGGNFFTDLHTAYPNAACSADSSSFQSFPANVTGVMAFSSSPYVLSNSLYFPQAKTIAMCLPSTLSSPGILFIGKGPYFLLPQSNVDVTSYLSYTPLLKPQTVDFAGSPDAPPTPPTPESRYGPPQTFGYYIGVDAIVIKKRSITFPANTTAKLGTNDPYTILRTDIYNSVIQRVSKVTKRIPRANAIAPFSLCFKTSSKDPKVSFKIPDIDFNLLGGKNWTMSTTNTMKQVNKDVACLAFIDGGLMTTSQHAIVIGTFQFQDNFLVFDLENSMFGFSSSLLRKRTSCSNCNFTLTHSD